MEDGGIVFVIMGLVFGPGIVAFLFAALRFRHRLFQEEAGAQEVETVLPTGLRLEGLQYSGPFSRVSVYPAFIAIRALGASCMIGKRDISDVNMSNGEWVTLGYLQQGHRHEIKILTPECDRLLKAVQTMMKGVTP
ncbi:MAG: hypothetical protein GX615_14285 [Lentisphaerae bacterium]|nr:hypothetical protein [Lentisphaerota bacterium]